MEENKTVIITGANGNLGSAVTRLFLSKGYRVIAVVQQEAMKKDLADHPALQAEAVDLADEAAATSFVEQAIRSAGKIDGALLLVGGFALGDIAHTRLADIKHQLVLNFDTAFNVAKPLFIHMKAQNRGRLVFVGARPALVPAQGKNVLAYSLSKSLLFRLAECLNADAKGTNVTATVIAPSTIDTPANRKSMPDANPADWVRPEALADILEFLVSDESAPLRETVLKVYNNA